MKMGIYTQGELRVDSAVKIETIEGLELEGKSGEHGVLILQGRVEAEEGDRILFSDLAHSILKLYAGQELLFLGLIQQIEITHEGGSFTLKLQAASATIKLDLVQKSRSFQDVKMTYKEVLQQALKDVPEASLAFYGKDKTLDAPVYQLEETDWQWIKRMASQLGEFPISGNYTEEPKIEIGLSERSCSKIDEAGTIETKVWQEKKQIYRQIKTGKNRNLGDKVEWKNKEYFIREKRCCLEKGLLWFYYTIARKEAFQRKPCKHPAVIGRRLAATVLETRNELVRVQFDMDHRQDRDRAYWYPWCPVSGNVLYCMPEVGEKVFIELEEVDGKKARAIEGVRTNGKGNPEMLPENRLFTTKDGKRMALSKERIIFQDLKNREPFQLLLADLFGIKVRSNQEIIIYAKENIAIKGERLYFQAPKEISILRKDTLDPTVINMCNGFDSIGQTNQVTAGKEGVEEFPRFAERNKYLKKPKEYSLLGLEQGMIASTPTVRRADGLQRRICGCKVEGLGDERGD